MSDPSGEDLHLIVSEDGSGPDDPEIEPGGAGADRPRDADLETLRDAFVDAFNARDLDGALGLVHAEVEMPDLTGSDGVDALGEELTAIWERSPGALLTRAFLDGEPCAVGWLPDDDGCWSRAALVCFEATDGVLTLVSLPDDPGGLDAAEAEDPTGEELDEWADWSEWDRGEETVTRDRRRLRP